MKTILCSYCGYIWQSKTKMLYVACPKCLNKVRVYKRKEDKKDETPVEQ